jgi:hypothetical protein
VEPAGIKPATSCLQIRTTGSSVVATDDQTGGSEDDDPHLAPSVAVVCDKCLPPACLLGWFAAREVDPGAGTSDAYRSRKPVWAFSPSGVRIPPSPSFTVVSQHRPQIRLGSGRYRDLVTQVNSGQRRPHWPVRHSPHHSPQGRTADLTGAVLKDRAEMLTGAQSRRSRAGLCRLGGCEVNGPCALSPPHASRRRDALARGPPGRPVRLGNEKDRVAARSLST